jgi:hypothetical protein
MQTPPSDALDLVAATAGRIDAALRAIADPVRSTGQRAYLKSERIHLGVTLPDLRRIVRLETRPLGPGRRLGPEEAFSLADLLWSPGRPGSDDHRGQVFDHCLAAVETLDLARASLSPSDLPRLEPYLRDARTWALVDPISVNLAGTVVAAHPAPASDAVLDAWCGDDDFWIRRACLLAELRPLASGEPFARFAGHADRLLEEREFFIRKAIGWVLRETGRRRRAEVVDYVLPRAARLSGVTWREVVRHLPADDVLILENARRQGRAS